MEYVSKNFSNMAQHYAGRTRYSSLFFTKLARALKIDTNASVLDLACGTGEICQGLSPYAGQVLGVDNSEGMLDLAFARSIPNAAFIHHDLNGEAVKAESAADLVTIGRAIQYLEGSVLKETLEVSLKPGGLVAICGAGLAEETPWAKQFRDLRHQYRSKKTSHDFQGRKAMQSIGFEFVGMIGDAKHRKFFLDEIIKLALSYSKQTQGILDDMDSFTTSLEKSLIPFKSPDDSYPGIEVSWACVYRNRQ